MSNDCNCEYLGGELEVQRPTQELLHATRRTASMRLAVACTTEGKDRRMSLDVV